MAAGFSLVAGEGSLMPSVGATGGGRSFAPVGDAPPDRGQWSLLSALPRPEVATLSELFIGGARNGGARDGGATGFLLAQLERALAGRGGPLLWVQERMAILEGGRIYPPGIDVAALIHVEAKDARAALWAMEEGLRCAALGGVIGELWGDPRALDFTATRRLAVAAERSGVPAWLVRLGGSANLSGARMRWRVASAPSGENLLDPRAPGAAAWDAELFRARGVAPGRWVVGDERGEAKGGAENPVGVAAAAGDRAVDDGREEWGRKCA
jgi:protein ImuA